MTIIDNYDPERYCTHTPDQTYTREPCSCGRELWPPRGRGRGESLLSPRRIAAKLRALDALELHVKGLPYERIARRLGYSTAGGAWRAVQRIRDQEAEWVRFEHETGRKRYETRPLGSARIAEHEAALAKLEEEMRTGGLDGKRLQQATARLRTVLLAHTTTAARYTDEGG